MKAELVPMNGDAPIPITKDVTVVGRGHYCDVQVDHPSLSKRHCVLVKTDGLLVVRDLARWGEDTASASARVAGAASVGTSIRQGGSGEGVPIETDVDDRDPDDSVPEASSNAVAGLEDLVIDLE